MNTQAEFPFMGRCLVCGATKLIRHEDSWRCPNSPTHKVRITETKEK